MTDFPRWPAPWVRAALDLGVLATLDGSPRHGYAIAQVLAKHGFGLLKGGSLYPALNRLEEAGDIAATWVEGHGGPGRKEYALTSSGRTRLARDLGEWQALGRSLTTMRGGTTSDD